MGDERPNPKVIEEFPLEVLMNNSLTHFSALVGKNITEVISKSVKHNSVSLEGSSEGLKTEIVYHSEKGEVKKLLRDPVGTLSW